MTMDELGGALGFEGKICLSAYPSMKPVPHSGEDMILKLADALRCNYKAISDYSLVLLKISLKHFSGLKKVPHLSRHVEKVQDSQSTQLPAT